MKDLTKGKPSRLILAFALPIFLANLLQLTYSLVDTRIVGSFLGEDALAAVGATSSLSNLIIGFLMGLSNGFAIITAQRFGAKDLRGVKKSFAMSLTLGIAVAAGLTVLGLLFLQPILRFLNVPENLRTVAGSYIVIIIAGLIATFLYDACAAALRALGDTITPLVILAISVILNIAGDLFFVVVLKTGVRGAAVATISAQALAFVICWIYMIKRYELLRLSGDDFKEPQPQMIQSMLSAGLSMGFMSSLINIGSLTLQTAINKLGQNIIVAHTAARKISEMFIIMTASIGYIHYRRKERNMKGNVNYFLQAVLNDMLSSKEEKQRGEEDNFAETPLSDISSKEDDSRLEETGQQTQAKNSKEDEEFLNKLNMLIHENMAGGELSIKFLTDKLAMSRASLYNKVKFLTGLGVNDYINRLRIEKSVFLLTNTNMNINEISYEVGFSYPRYFSTSFKQIKGMTPTRFKEENKKN